MTFRMVKHRFGSGPSSARPFDVTEMQRKRFRRHVIVGKPNECWTFDGPHNSGYPIFTLKIDGMQRPVGAHRVAYRIANGEIPHGMSVLHSCDNRGCVNPRHLSLGDHAENMRQAKERGRMSKGGGHGLHETCIRGHILGAFNRNWSRGCRFCHMLHEAEEAAYREDTFHEWINDEVRSRMPSGFAEFVALVGEKNATCFAHWAGMYGRPMLTLDVVSRMYKVSRQRIDQRRVRVMQLLGVESKPPQIHRAKLAAA